MDRSDASALADLKMHWDEAYVIALDGNIWSARYHTSTDELRAHTSSELRELIRSDYAYRQKADLVAYDADDEDDGIAESEEALDDDNEGVVTEAPAGEGEADAATGCVQRAGKAKRQDSEIESFAAIRGERMSM